ncbi:glycoside hydrolase family 1 protein [Nitrospirillum viridazoti]|uniref:Beta-glucosidase n=1 Tax=Nitrospirillum viridazoti CBAmc TaxID=1441467 RepID=A0A248K0K7_9PROT|nr:family 1 glycosylhydrolase [Nitrospirillum amazonense]ASG24523.1 beta-glucosidase [Nitrospirillum amazonense CBAmc]TWB37125.1 aryl-beta-glucosidase [Nitrospirillum amazonense]
MATTRRTVLAGLAAATALNALPARAARRPAMPKGFLWGAAISAHQSEGNDTNSDSWLLEHLPETVYKEPSGGACDSYHRYEQDFAIARAIGLNCYRFGIEWARIEPEPGHFSQVELDHYTRVLAACRAHGLLPIVTYNHFTVPLWFATRGGWEAPDSPDLFARFCERATRALGGQIGMASPFNEANIHLLVKVLRGAATPEYRAARTAMIAAAARATQSPRFSSILFADPDRIDAHLLEAHAKAYQAIKAGPGDFPVGVTLTTQAVEAVGDDSLAPTVEATLYGGWWDAVNASDFVGVQAYTRLRVDAKGLTAAPPGAEMTAAGYEYYPQALGQVIRLAARKTAKPIFVTESGIATDDDARRVAWLDASVAEVEASLRAGIDVRSYIYWSLLDNFEWTQGYGQHFGLVAVDRDTFARTPKPSSQHLADIIRGG